jgi:hypothetical protein
MWPAHRMFASALNAQFPDHLAELSRERSPDKVGLLKEFSSVILNDDLRRFFT